MLFQEETKADNKVPGGILETGSRPRVRRYVDGFNPRWQRSLPAVDKEKWLKDSVVFVVSGGNQGWQQGTRWDSGDRGQGQEREGM